MAELTIAVLGPMRIRRAGQELPTGSGQRQAVLGMLAERAGRAVPARELAHGLWGEDEPASAAAVLRNHISRLRAVIDPPGAGTRTLLSRDGGYALEVPGRSLDAVAFASLAADAARRRDAGDAAAAVGLYRRALALWQGAALAGLPGPWAEQERARLTEQRLAVLRDRLALELELGRPAGLVAELTALCAEHPLREPLTALLMTALYRGGRQAEALEVFDTTARTLAAELGVRPGPELRELRQRILCADLPPASAAPPAGVTATGPGPAARCAALGAAPAQLPSDVGDFTGRVAEVGAVAAALAAHRAEAGGPAVVLVHGGWGTGKSTLAVRAARTVRAEFADGQLFAGLGGARGDVADPATVLGGFLRALGVPAAEIPAGTAARAALYRAVTADRRLLVVLDEAADEAHVRPLLPAGPRCAVLVTARGPLPGLTLSAGLRLGRLTPQESAGLLAAVAGTARIAAEPAAAEAVAAACGHLPLALRIAATRISARPGWSLAAFAARLRDEGRRLAELRVGELCVEADFRRAHHRLPAELAAALGDLARAAPAAGAARPAGDAVPALGPSAAGPSAAGPAAPGTPPERSGIMERLLTEGLLEPSDRPGPGYRLDELVRLCVLAGAGAGTGTGAGGGGGNGVEAGDGAAAGGGSEVASGSGGVAGSPTGPPAA
ncbi:AfsR/SARP family transcriptional regulator [Kitasatospora sp. NBC_00240]|uniref:AfsR/SARP family transcriptional regulator n=1 Tax=Kitasatospora sp. NBC_00240 TaxID=2903567 RepID=UPI00224D9A83|nr:AfsR/SARP family transcriptional regulator [Kitasatospora sp. NBC_00240]MCX5208888.1 AfsR/SARP family transcriptional regulator [Kitasatospora sp. NBC_00240]